MPFQTKEEKKAYDKIFYQKNKERIKESVRKYKEANRDEINRKQREAYAADPSKRKESNEKWRRDNMDKVRARARRWKAANKDKVKVYSQGRYSRRKDHMLEVNKRWQRTHPEAVKRIRDRSAHKRIAADIEEQMFTLGIVPEEV